MLHDTTPSSYGNHPEHAAGWTDARIAQLKDLWRDGKSATEIASIMGGGLTRNGVLGKVHRLKLGGRQKPIAATKATGSKGSAGKYRGVVNAARKAREKTGAGLAFKISRARKDGLTGADAMEAVLRRSKVEFEDPIEEGVDVTHLLGLTQLNEHTCKWPHGDPLLPNFGFCGDHPREGSPYCDKHHRRAHLRPQP